MTCNIHFGNQDGSQDRFYYKYASVTDALFSMRTGTYTGTEFKINKNGIIPLYGEVNGDTGETEEDVAMFNKGARYKISCYRTDSDNAKLPLYTDGKSPSIAAGTEFVILNIVMPESYVTMAENTLEKAALDYLSRYDHENRTVSLDISSGFVAEHPNLFIDFIEGNMLKVRDDGIGVFDFSDNGQIVDMQLQIQSLEIKYSKENMFPSYSCTIARRKILSFYERLAQENQTASTQNTTNVTLGESGTGSGTNIFSEQLLNDLIVSFQKFNGWFEWDEVNQALRCKSAFYTNQWISALGAQSGSGEPGGGEGGLIQTVYGFADLGKTFDDSNLSNTFNAYTINEIWKLAKEGGMNTDKLWQELGKDDPTKKIHISHLPDNKFVTLDTEQTVTASKIFTGQLSTANVVPSVNNASTLGLESKRWENIYAVDANISGTVKTQALQVGDIKIIYDSVNKAVTFEHIDGSTEIGFYTRGWISALGVSPGGSGGSGGDGLVKNVYGFSNLGTTFSDSDLDNTFNAYTINEIWKMAKEGGGIKNITQSGSGNAVTNMALSSDGKTITAVFGETFARQQDLGTLNNTVTQLSNKLNNFLEGSDADNIINKWKELEAFLDGLTESDNLADLLALKADKTITISAGAGLTGGGNLSANRTISLATSGVKAGTYTKVTVDTYGRVTVGDNPTTLAGYGITDAVTLTTAQTISGQKTFTKNILMNSGTGLSYDENTVFRNTSGNTIIASYGDGMIYFRPNGHNNTEGAVWISKTGYLNGVSAGFTGGVSAARLTANEYIQIGDAQLVYDSANKALRVKHRTDGNTVGFYSDGWVSALGVKTGGSGGGSGVIKTVYSFANLTDGTTFSDSDLDNTFNAYTIKKLYDMAGQGGLDADAMWTELKKADSSKIIDASHIPTSVLDGRWVKKTGDTMTGVLTIKNSTYNKQLIIWSAGSTAKNQGEGIWFRSNDDEPQGVVLRHEWYDTFVPGYGLAVSKHDSLEAGDVNMFFYNTGRFISKAPQGTSPYQCVSTTVNANLNADLLDGLHEYSFLRHRDTYGIDGYNTLWAQIGIRQYNNAKPDGMANPIYNHGAVISLPGGNTRLDIWYNHTSSASDSPTNGIQYRSGFNDDKKPWRMLLDSVNYASYSDGRYVKKSGDTMTGDLTMNNTKGFNIGWSTRVVKTSGNWIHGGSDAASSTDANLRFGSWYGIGWYPTISGQTVAQGKNAMWLNVRTGVLDVHSNITSHNGYLAANWDSARRLVMGGGSTYAWIDSRNSSNNVLCNIVLQDNKVTIGNYAESSRFVSTVGTGTAPYQCNSTTLNSNLNADMLDNWHLNFLPRNYNIGRCYAVRFALGGEDNGWKKIFACSESGTGPYRSVTVWGRIWYAYGNHANDEVRNYHFCAIFQMRSGPSASDSNVGILINSARLYLPTFAKGMDNIRLVRVGTNNFELQVRQIGSYHNANIEYQYWSNGCNVSAWESLQSTSNTTVAVSAGGASTLADSRASSADVWTTARTFYIQDHDASHTGAGVSVNGSANVYLKLPNSIQCSDWFRSTGNSGWYHQNYGGGIYMEDSNFIRNFGGKRLLIQTDTYDTLRLVRTSGSGGSSIVFYNGGGTFRGQLGVNAYSWFSFDTGTATANQNVVEISPAGGIHSKAEITAKASGSDIRLKKDIQNYNAMNIINRFRSVKYHWNDIAKANSEVYNNDYDQFGLIAQDLIAGGFKQWVRDVFHDYYTVTYERLIPVVWKGLQEVDDEVTRLKKRVKELEKRLGINN